MGVREKLQRTPIRRSRRQVALDGVRDAKDSIAGQFRRDDSSAKLRAGAVLAGIAGLATAALVAVRKLVDRGEREAVEAQAQSQAEESVPQADANGERRPLGVTGQ